MTNQLDMHNEDIKKGDLCFTRKKGSGQSFKDQATRIN
jgi:hypothetical protein